MTQTLQLLLEQAERARDQALAALQQAQARAAQGQTQARQLGDYQREYDQRWQQQFSRDGGAASLLQIQRQFGQRLDEAIGQQRVQQPLLDARVAHARQQLQQCELRVASVRKLLERRQAEQSLRQQRAEQKASDEFSAKRHRDPLRPGMP